MTNITMAELARFQRDETTFLAEAIRDLVNGFEAKTGLHVEDVRLDRLTRMGEAPIVRSVQLRVEVR